MSTTARRTTVALGILAIFLSLPTLEAQDEAPKSIPEAPPRAEGEGPFDRLILRGATLIAGTGSPPLGPVDIVIEGNRIVDIKGVGFPGVPIDPEKRPKAEEGDRELDLHGMYVLPGFIDLHGHIGGVAQGTPAEYVFKLWMGHGITTIRDPGSGNGLEWVLDHKARSASNAPTAPIQSRLSVTFESENWCSKPSVIKGGKIFLPGKKSICGNRLCGCTSRHWLITRNTSNMMRSLIRMIRVLPN